MNTPKPIKTVSIVVIFLGCTLGAMAQAQTVNAPALPPGSHMVKIKPGMSQAEEKRSERAHHHKFHNKKDVTRDDTVHDDSIHNHSTPAAGQASAKKSN